MNPELRIKYNNSKRKGLTIIELIFVVAIIALIIGFSYASFASLNQTQALERDFEALMALLKDAQSNTRNSINSSNYGVYFELGSNKAVSFKGVNYDENDPENSEFTLSNKVIISEVNLNGGGMNVVFERPKGNTFNFGTVKLSLVDGSKSYSISIHKTGVVEIVP